MNKLNKKGAIDQSMFWLIGVGALIILFTIMWIVISVVPFNISGDDVDTSTISNGDVVEGLGWLDFIVGPIPTFLEGQVANDISVIIIVVAVFFLIFVTFGDVIATFGTFNEWVAWTIGFLIALIAANLNFSVFLLAFFVGIFSFLGTIAIFIGIGTAFVAFVGVNLGIRSMGPWLMRRKAMTAAATTAVETEAGGTALAGTIKGLGAAGEALKDLK